MQLRARRTVAAVCSTITHIYISHHRLLRRQHQLCQSSSIRPIIVGCRLPNRNIRPPRMNAMHGCVIVDAMHDHRLRRRSRVRRNRSPYANAQPLRRWMIMTKSVSMYVFCFCEWNRMCARIGDKYTIKMGWKLREEGEDCWCCTKIDDFLSLSVCCSSPLRVYTTAALYLDWLI